MLETVELGRHIGGKEFKELEPTLRVSLLTVQYELRASDFSVVLVLGGDDGRGCAEALNRLHEWMDARYLEANVYEDLSEDEKERPRFWRYWRALPAKGRIGIFSREWTYRAVMDRVRGKIDEVGLDRRIRQIRGLEKALADDGSLVLKLWLHASSGSVRERAGRDRRLRKHYDDFVEVSERVLRRTSTSQSLWNLVESDDPHYRDVTMAQLIIHALAKRLGEPPEAKPRKPATSTERDPLTVLDRIDLDERMPEKTYKSRLARSWTRLEKLSHKAHAKGLSAVLAFEGWDAAGKGGVIRRLTKPMDAAHYRVIPVSAPTDEELAHHYLWRFWRQLPGAGHIAIFDRTWYGRVLVERLEGLASEDAWTRAYSEINDFEEQLVEKGFLLLKFWLHISSDEQMRRFKAREKIPFKKYKLTPDDYRNREKWSGYEAAADEMIRRTSTEFAPWHLVAANDKPSARIQVLETVIGAMGKALEKRKKG